MKALLTAEQLSALSPLQQDEYWMQHCLLLAAQAAERGEVPVGAVVVKDNSLLAQAFNQPIGSHDPCAHAEVLALRKAGEAIKNYRLAGATLYVSLEPCSMCAGAMVHSRISRLVYGASEPKAGVIESQGTFLNSPFLNHRIEACGGILAEQASSQLSAFFKQRREQKKAVKRALD